MIERRRLGQFSKRSPIQDAIATCAYERFLTRGREHGHDLDDWLAAEQEFVWRQSAPAVGVRTTGQAEAHPGLSLGKLAGDGP